MIKQIVREEKKRKKVPHKEQKSYVKPQLTEYGHVERLTQGGSRTSLEGVGAKRP
jgi:hypothetical protein